MKLWLKLKHKHFCCLIQENMDIAQPSETQTSMLRDNNNKLFPSGREKCFEVNDGE